MKRLSLSAALPLSASLGLFILLLCFPAAARAGAAAGLSLCAELLIPTLLPFFAAAGLLNRLGLPDVLAGRLAPLMGRVFSLPGAAAGPLLLGLTGGYPLGAASAAELCLRGTLTREEAERLLRFCDNTGPAFAVAALGAGVFGSVRAGLVLWLSHVLSALLTGLLLCRKQGRSYAPAATETQPPLPFAAAFCESAGAAALSLLRLSAFVVLFSSLRAVLDETGLFPAAAGELAVLTGAELSWCRALLCSLLELTGAVQTLRGLPCTAMNLALASFALSWGGLCIQLQSMSVTAPAGLRCRGRLAGKLLHGLLSALITLISAAVIHF